MKRRATRGKTFFAIFSVLVIISFGTFSWAVPIGLYDFSVTPGGPSYNITLTLGNTLTFDEWWYIPNPSTQGEPWARVYIQETAGTISTLAEFGTNSTSVAWAPHSPPINTSAFYGHTLNVRFSLNDFNVQDPNPTFFVRNMSTGYSVPEPSTLLLLGSGLLGLVGLGRGRMKK